MKSSGEGLFTIIDACRKLETLNLTSCRGVRVTERRSFFEVSSPITFSSSADRYLMFLEVWENAQET